MKKKILLSVIILAVLAIVVGCTKKEDEKVLNDNKVGGWEIVLDTEKSQIEEDAEKAFNDATTAYVGMDYEVVALLGKQVVAGTNYMFLAKGTPVVPEGTASYKIVVVYRDLEGKSSITKVNDFDYTKYTNKEKSYENENLSGGWYTEVPNSTIKLDERVQNSFDAAQEKLVGITYYPIAVLGKQIVSGTNYAVLCYGKLSTANADTGVFLVTLYEDLDNNAELISSSHIDLADYNN
jgi:hypothetical protein